MTGRDEEGSLAVEIAMAAPGLLLILLLVFGYGRVAGVNGTLEAGARDAARTATSSRSYVEAQGRATEVVTEAIAEDAPAACRSSLRVTVSDTFAPGEPVTVTATCRYGLGDLGLPGVGGDLAPVASFTSVLDPNRGVEEP